MNIARLRRHSNSQLARRCSTSNKSQSKGPPNYQIPQRGVSYRTGNRVQFLAHLDRTRDLHQLAGGDFRIGAGFDEFHSATLPVLGSAGSSGFPLRRLVATRTAQGEGLEGSDLTIYAYHIVIGHLDRGEVAGIGARIDGEGGKAISVRGVPHG